MNILYICNPNSIHDQKWMKYFAGKEEYNIYVVGESENSEDLKLELKALNIKLLPPISSFSVAHPWKNYQSIQQLKQYIKEYKINLVHVLFATPYAIWVNYLKTPYIITTRGSDVLIVLPELKKAPLIKRIYFNWLYKQFKKAFQRAQSITCTSTLQVDQLKRMFNVEAEVIRTGVEVEEIEKEETLEHLPPELKGKSFVFSPRFMSPVYNIEYQLDAIELLCQEIIAKYIFVFIRGIYYDKNYYQKQTNRLAELEQKIKLDYVIFDYLSQKSLWICYKNAALTIMTPKSDGTPNSALEAMMCECPLIMPALNYDQQLFKNNAYQVPLDNTNQLKNTIEIALTNTPIDMLKQAKKAVSEHGNRLIEMKKLESIYHKL